MIYIPSNRYLEGIMPEIRMGLEGWFTCQAIKRGRVVRERSFRVETVQRQAGPFHNLITDLGLDRLGANVAGQVYQFMHVGTGTSTPVVADTELANFLANVAASPTVTSGTSGSPDFYAFLRMEWTSAVGAMGNNNLTEIGVGGQNTNGLLFSRELIRDPGGTPTSFPISDEEQFRGIYELRMYQPQTDSEAEVSIGGVTYDTITRAINVNQSSIWGPRSHGTGVNNMSSSGATQQTTYTGDLVSITTGSLSGVISNASSDSTADYTNGNHYRDITAQWNASAGSTSIRTVKRAFRCGWFQVRYDPVIPKDGTKTLILHQRIAWGRA